MFQSLTNIFHRIRRFCFPAFYTTCNERSRRSVHLIFKRDIPIAVCFITSPNTMTVIQVPQNEKVIA